MPKPSWVTPSSRRLFADQSKDSVRSQISSTRFRKRALHAEEEPARMKLPPRPVTVTITVGLPSWAVHWAAWLLAAWLWLQH